MAELAEVAAAEALSIYEELQHPELGGMYNVMGNLWRSRYLALEEYRPRIHACGDLGDKAIEHYSRGADTFIRMGLDLQDKNYGSCLSNMGLVYEDRRDWEEVLPCYLKGAIAGEVAYNQGTRRAVEYQVRCEV
jgi:hypothetical protein